MRYASEPRFEHGTIPKVGILLINLGTPDEPSAAALRRYLQEFLSDPRVVEIPRVVWNPILHGIILRTRPQRSAAKYAAIWTTEGSPLRVHSERQAKLLKGFLGERIKSPFAVEYGMRYGNPSIASALGKLKQQQCDRILIFPLYPQYAASSTATGFDATARELRHWRNQPALRTIKHFHDHPAYIAALAQSVREFWMKNGRPDKLVMSFHGVPRQSLDKGDPYHCECQKTARLLGAALGLRADAHLVTFQSRFGRAEWLKPYTAATLEKLAKEGTQRIDVICPGFVSDCLETLEEIGIEGKATFLGAGGKDYRLIPCLNEREDWIRAMCDIALANLDGWVSAHWDAPAIKREAEARRALALNAGAKH
jgi:protoporphyrin/coproporphyrin ferrochelatase